MGGRVGAGLNHRECRALPEALGTRIVAAGGVLQLEGSSRRARATVGGRESRRRGLVRRRRRDLGPSRAQAAGFAPTVEELRLTVVVSRQRFSTGEKPGRRRDGGGPKTDPPGRGNPGGSR